MPYEEDPVFSKDLNDDNKIWRYIDFAKFVDLLERKEQYFVRASKLIELDPYEGHFDELKLLSDNDEIKIKHPELYQKMKNHSKKEHPKFLCVNCWHINEIDSDAMWKLYATTERGIAIQTTIRNLKKSLVCNQKRIDISKVRYIDHSKEKIIYTNLLDRFSMKGVSFEHERELRMFVLDIVPEQYEIISHDNQQYRDEIKSLEKETYKSKGDKNGVYVNIDLNQLIEKVYVSPLVQDWFVELVKSMMRKYGLNDGLVVKSKIYEKLMD